MPSIEVLDSTIHYEEIGAGAPIVFLHGNPASSHMWRKVLPLVGEGRLLAPDLIGMGRSGKPGIDYTFADHARYLDAWFDAMGLEDVVLVGHDWGGALALDRAARHPGSVRGVAVFETFLRPLSWADLGEGPRARSEAIRSPKGEELVLGSDFFIQTAYTGGVLTPVSEEEMAAYLAPFPTPESRRPVLAWARSFPLDGEPADVHERVAHYEKWLRTSDEVPKLLITFDGSPTLLITPEVASWSQASVAGLEIAYGGAAGHHAAEDQPERIAAAISTWADHNRLR
ncbi:haloalkane dehalogenase [Nonomuraea sp. NPDC050790]|uniref:haloalkane dehalogenase n=1 Tax=Nonomuraea sp. NPDC050790 TaxID=3364371 RepID=UPI0037AE7F06